MMRHTQLLNSHKALGAKFVDFHGWDMPLEYSGIVHEHEAVRTAAGLFDVSHMGAIEIMGSGVYDFIRRVLPFNPETLPRDMARYSFMLNERGGMKDDLMAFHLNADHFLLVVNASTADSDMAWLQKNAAPFGVTLMDLRPQTSIIALQGPRSWDIIKDVTGKDPASFKYHSFIHTGFSGIGFMLAKTGYTGERGFEIYVHNKAAAAVWDRLLEAGKPYGLLPCGLGARDTLRLEMGYLLYGIDADESVNPIEAGYESAIDFGNTEFIGRDALMKTRDDGPKRSLVGLTIKDHAVPRNGCRIFSGDEQVGTVTSGNFSPMLKHGIALAYINAGAESGGLKIDIRDKLHDVEVVRLPFYKK